MQEEAVLLLLKQPDNLIDADTLCSLLHECVVEGFHSAVRRIISYSKEFYDVKDIVNRCNDEGWTSVMLAARYGHTSVLTTLLKYCQDLQRKSKANGTALLCACRSGYLSSVKVLLDFGAEINALENAECSPLIVAAQYGYESIVNELIDRGCDVNFTSKSNGISALMIAVLNGHTSTVRMLVENDADLEILNRAEMTALDLAYLKKRKSIQRILQQTLDTQELHEFGKRERSIREIHTNLLENTSNDFALQNGNIRKTNWWSNLFKRKSEPLNSPKLPDFQYGPTDFKNPDDLRPICKMYSQSVDYLHNDKFLLPISSPCRQSTVKQTIHAKISRTLPNFDELNEERKYQLMPSSLILTRVVNNGRRKKMNTTPKDKLYEELQKFSIQDLYPVLLEEEIDIESLVLLTPKDVDGLRLPSKTHNERLKSLIFNLKKSNTVAI